MNQTPFAVITGASRGIGAQYARALAAQGYDVLLVGRDRTRLESLKQELRHISERSIWVESLDLSQPDIAQTLLIIINNAKDVLIERQTKDPIINVRLFSDKDIIKMYITDNAGGIEKDVKNKIFNAYYTTKENNKGSGLGLYIAKMIVENKMNGSLYIEDIKEGTSFCIERKKSK